MQAETLLSEMGTNNICTKRRRMWDSPSKQVNP